MSILGSYLRLSPAEIDRALQQPGWAARFGADRAEQDERCAPAERRCHRTGTAWPGLAHLLARHDLPADLVHGERPLPDDEDGGYGPPRLLTPEQVAAVASRLADLPFDALAADRTPADLAAAGLGPASLWTDPHAFEHLAAEYAALRAFLDRTARYRHGLLVRYA
ncbi:YfbM family protein [Kitasatospora cheerisanensis]|uniref:DUF1877 domain-containing protein n=1 Tax=Kitasatospora cheerisanensis KCTC 2395 TaxID=1348663 RepID=A0A066YYB8_9ACTN|nr:YfbM family protein [Kitasatospora cheerisanensis]KDN86543.1 hypothetical protein KCH_16390 [Kitasatospora cheerisanensis KCTC 2395]